MNTNSVSTSSAGSVAPIPTGQGNNQTSINDIPQEIRKEIFKILLPQCESSMVAVCKLWSREVTELHEPSLKVFGEEAWQRYYNFDIEGETPPLPKKIIQITRSLRRRLKGKEEAPTCSLLLMPKGLTLNQLKDLVQNPIKGNSTRFCKSSWGRVFEELGDKPIEKSYWVLVTNDVIGGSRSKSYADQKKLIEKKAGPEWQDPQLLEAAVCSFMNYVSSEEDKTRLFSDRPWTFTRCQEQVYGYQLVVGAFEESDGGSASGGLFVDCQHNDFTHDCYGVAVCRKFC